jgi:hypothetical protein
MGSAAIGQASPLVGVNLFHRDLPKQTEEIAPAVLAREEKPRPPDLVIPIQVSDSEYVALMGALRPDAAHAPEDRQVAVPGSPVADGAGAGSPVNPPGLSLERPPGTPIV